MVRHGYSVSNFNKTFTGQLEAPLTGIGVKQAQKVCQYIFENYIIDAIYSSDLSRAVNTIKPLSVLTGLPIKTDADLREVYGGDWQGKKFEDLERLFPEDYARWKAYDKDMRPTNGESMFELEQRAVMVVSKIAKENPEKTVVIATHGGIIKALRGNLMGLTVERFGEIPYANNASVMEVGYDGQKLEILAHPVDSYLGDLITHMPKGA